MSTDSRVTVRVAHRYSAPAERVFDAWLDPKTADKWLFATPTGQMTRMEIDPRQGGKFTIVRRDGEEFEHVGDYVEIDRPRRLVFTFGVPRLSPEFTRVAIEIFPAEPGCELTLAQDGVLAGYAEPSVKGWTMILDSLERALGDTA
ncbi:MAG TPA: SRPBCC domain-containing protein [Rhizomicrobium sp.]|jgi:uncharacterized protein YndB with AHSA1/START domain|nr:SRPBCC domain-containing protein [Rhizomicrobium sp.]